MAITSEIIGRLGGADVEVIPVEGAASGGKGSSEVIATIDVPAGETWLVAAICQVTPASSSYLYYPDLHLGGVSVPTASPSASPSRTHGLATTASETVSFTIERRSATGSDTFTGHVYTVKL